MPSTQASVILVTHNSQAHVGATLEALYSDPDGPAQVVVVDNGSIDSTLDIVDRFPAELIPLPGNQGFPAGCNLGAQKASYNRLVFLNPDTVPSPGWLPPLLAALEQPGVGAAMPVIELTYRPGHFFTSRSALTYLGFAWSTDAGEPIPPGLQPQEVPFPSGACFAIARDTFEHLEGFRQEYFLYLEDVDLGWRLRLSGLVSVLVPGPGIAHDYEFNRHADKMFYLERNRLRMVLSNYERRTLMLLTPALAAVELGVLAAAAKNGWLRQKLRSYRAVWRLRHRIRRERGRVHAIRVVPDRDLFPTLDAAFTGITQMPLPPYMGFIDRAIVAYQRLVQRLL